MRCRALLMLAALGLVGPVHAVGNIADINIYDATAGSTLPVYRHDGRYYVAGEPGHEYLVSIASREAGRVLAVTSVDGVNVISGETASPGQDGYVLGAYQSYDVLGWRKSLERIASFYFTRLSDSYAARTGRPRNVGVIGVALFRERYRAVPNDFVSQAAPVKPEARAQEYDSNGATASRGDESVLEKSRMAPAPAAPPVEDKLGTGHGRGQDSVVVNTGFERASNAPAEIIAIYYDSRRNLIAQGVIPRLAYGRDGAPDPFPDHFVPDP